MNILYHHRTQGTGAEGVHIAYIVKGFRQLGHNVDVVCPNDMDPTRTAGNNPYAQKKGLKAGMLNFLSRVLPQCLFEMLEIIYNFAAYFKIRKILRNKPVQLLFERYAFFLWMGAYWAEARRIFYIVEVNEVACEARVRKQFFVELAKSIESYVFTRADAIIVVSEFLKEKIKAMGIDEGKIHVVPNAVDEKEFDPALQNGQLRQRFHFNDSTVVLGFIGWFVAWHNLENLIDVFSQIARDKDVRLFLVGDGVLKTKLRTMVEEWGVQDKVIFPGAVTYDEIPSYIHAMDICVIPGSNEYRSPIKLFEYMAMKKAIAAPRLKPIEQVVDENKDGVLFDQDDPSSLKDALTDLIEHKEKRAVLGENARLKILKQHTWSLNAKRIISLVTFK